MRLLHESRQALRALLRFRRRSLFMAAGVSVGIAALTTLNAIGENTRRDTMKRVRNMLGTFDTILVRPGGKTRGMVSLSSVDPSLRFEDAAALAGLPDVKQVARLQNAFDVDVSYRDRQVTPGVFGVSENWLALRGDEVAAGQFFTAGDDRRLARITILGTDVQKALFGDEPPIGKTIRIGGVPFEVRGVLASRGAGPAGASLDNIVLIPVSTASRRLFNRDFLTMMIVQLKDPSRSLAAASEVTGLLRARHRIAPGALDDFNITDPQAVLKQLNSVNSTLAALLTGVALLVMLTAGIVITALMTLGVSERRSEIGLRRAVGAARGDIVFQFLFEALAISAAGGAMGAAAAIGVVSAIAEYQKSSASVDSRELALAVALAAAIGIVFGGYPAWRASRVDPVQALRA